MTNILTGRSSARPPYTRPWEVGAPLGLASAFLIALALPGTGFAQDTATPVDSREAVDFFNAMSERIQTKPGIPASAVEVGSDGRAKVGYYRIVVRKVADPANSRLESKGCKAALKSLGDQRFFDVVLDKKKDVGVAVSIPQTLQPASADDGDTSRTEIDLFRITQSGGDRCAFELSEFSRNGDFIGRWIPLEQDAAIGQVAPVKFRTWYSDDVNKARVDAFWTGLSGIAATVGGPLPAIGAALFAGGADTYAVRAQAQRGLLSFTNEIHASPKQKRIALPVTPPDEHAKGTPYAPPSIVLAWDLAGGAARDAFTYKLSYTVEVEYLASQLYRKSEMATLDSGRKWTSADFANLLVRPREPGGPLLTSASDAVDNLSKQKEAGRFQAACPPALASLKTLGLSAEDRALLSYAIARTNLGMRAASDIDCLKTQDVRNALARVGITFGVVADPTKAPQWAEVLQASARAFRAPAIGGSMTARLKLDRFLDAELRIGGTTDLLKDSAGRPVFVDAASPYTISKKDFLASFAKVAGAQDIGCLSPQSSDKTPIVYGFPSGSEMTESQDRSLVHLVQAKDGTIFYVVLGVKGAVDDDAVIDQIWVGSAFPAAHDGMVANGCSESQPKFVTFLANQTPAAPNTP